MKKNTQKALRLFASLFAICLLFTSCQQNLGEFNNRGGLSDERSQLDYSEMSYVHTDFQPIFDEVDRCAAYAAESGNQHRVLELYNQILQSYTKALTNTSLASLHSVCDRTSAYYREEYVYCIENASILSEKINTLTAAILESEYAEAAKQYWGDSFLASYEQGKDSYNPDLSALYARETELTSLYRELSLNLTVEVNGRALILDEIYQIQDRNTFNDALFDYYDAFATQTWELYSELLDLRFQMAELMNKDPVQMHYDIYFRDFSPEEAAEYCALIKKEIVPLYQWLDLEYSRALSGNSLDFTDVSIEAALPILKEALEQEFDPGMTEALDYILSKGLYDISDNPNKDSGAFSRQLSYYNAPFMYISPNHTFDDVCALFHEFGHCANFYLTPSEGWNSSFILDVGEINSQGLELLMFDYYDRFLESEEDIKLAQIEQLRNALDSMLSGCMEEEFQREVFAMGRSATLEKVNDIYGALYKEYYGDAVPLASVPGFADRLWAYIPHTIETPFYYLSYSVSAAASLEIWQIAQDDREQAIDAYTNLLFSNGIPFGEALENSGLDNPLTSDCISRLADDLEDFLIDWSSELAA